jgi:2,3-diaminopropionate biosynthesis protein SbnA
MLKNRKNMAVLKNLLDSIGDTPIVRLENLFPKHKVYAKLESANLTGSMKARSALGMINAAEAREELKPGMTIIESTSGNLGYALAAIGTLKGYQVKLVVDPKTDHLKRNILQAYGAELITIEKPDENGAYQPTRMAKVQELLEEIPNSWTPCQYHNVDNMMAHYNTTGPEISRDLEGKIDVLIGSIGTCGHLGGSAKYLKEVNPKLHVIGVQPEGSTINGGKYKPYLVQGPGLSFKPTNFDTSVIDTIINVSDRDSFYCARELARKEAILSGGSAGMIIHTIKEMTKDFPANQNIVAILADDGFRYAGNFYDDAWMEQHGIGQ